MTLGQKQRRFTLMICRLIEFAYTEGYELSFGHAMRCSDCKVGIKNSLHKSKLAVDFNLFKDGSYLSKTEDHLPLGLFWEALGGTWGGRFQESPPGAGNGFDGNHYQY